MRLDPKERNPKYSDIIKQADKEAQQELLNKFGSGIAQKEGYCHMLWDTQQRILEEKYGIEWKSPAEMNPGVLFD